MNTEQCKRVEELFDGLMRLPAGDWPQELARRCPDDTEVRSEVERLLKGIGEMSSTTAPGFFARFREKELFADERDDVLLGSWVGAYRILEKLGDGGFGSVYKAEQRHPIRRIVALKIIKLGRDTKEVIARFNSERQALARMDHPNIAKVLDAGSTDTGKPYFVMEYVPGLPITRFSDTNRLSINDRLTLFQQICDAITHAHHKAVIHRDIKAGNVLALIHDGKAEVKVIDFGIAKALTSDRLTDLTFNTAQGTMIGTYESMSPEQAEGSPDIDTRTDVYSLGVLLYELLTGALPFDRKMLAAATHDEVCRIIRDVEPLKPSARLSGMGQESARLAELRGSEVNSLVKKLSHELEWIPLKAMRKERERRYSSPREMSQDIQNYLDRRPLLAGPESRLYRWKKSLRRNSRLVGAVAAVMFALVLGIIGTTIQSIRARHATKTAQSSELRAIEAEKSALKLADDNGRLAREKSAALERANHLLGLAFLEKARRLDVDKDKFAAAMTAAYALGFRFDGESGESSVTDAPALLQPQTQEWRDARDLAVMRGTTRLLWRSPAGVHHGGPIRSIAFSPDSSTLASAGDDESLRVWKLTTGKPIHRVEIYAGEISCVAFSPDGKTLAADIGAKTHAVCFHDVTTGTALPTLLSHSAPIRSICYSPDGKLIATAARDSIVRIWSTPDGKLIRSLTGHTGEVTSLSFGPDGRSLASSSSDKTIRLWDVATGKPSAILQSPGGAVNEVKFSPDGKTLAAALEDATICLWDAGGAQRTRTLQGHSDAVTTVCFDPTGKSLASGSDDKTVRVWDVARGQALHAITDHTDKITCVRFSPDGKILASSARDNRICIWNVSEAKSIQKFEGLSDAVTSVGFSPDGATVVSASRDNTLCVWDAAKGTRRAKLRGTGGERRPVVRAVFSPDGKALASVSSNGPTLTLWDPQTKMPTRSFEAGDGSGTEACVSFSADGQKIACGWKDNAICIRDLTTDKAPEILKGHTDQITGVVFSPDRKLLASSSNDKTARLWDLSNGKTLFTLTSHTREVTCVSFSPDGKMLATGSKDDTIRLWDVSSGTILRPLQGHDLTVNSVCFSPDGKMLASASDDRTVRLWDLETGKTLQTLRGSPERVTSVSFSPDGTRLVCGSVDSTVSVWELASERPRQKLVGHTDRIPCVSFSPDGTIVASASFDKSARLWDAKTGALLRGLNRHTDQVYSVGFSAKGDLLATGSNDQTIRLWNPKTGEELFKDPLQGADGAITGLAFSPDGALLAAASRDPVIWVWNTATGKVAMKLTGHTDGVWCVAFTPDGKLLASGSRDRSIRLWDMPSGKPHPPLRAHTDRVAGLSFSSDGKMLASASYDKTIGIWDVASERLIHRFDAAIAATDSRQWVTSVSFSPTDRVLASAATDGFVRLWDPVTMQQLQSIRASDAGIFSVSFSPDGSAIACGSNDNSVQLWNIQADRPLRQYLKVYEFDGMELKPLPSVNLYGDSGFFAQTSAMLQDLATPAPRAATQGTAK